MDLSLSRPEFDHLWISNRVLEKLGEGLLIESVADDVPASNPRYAGGRSQIIKLSTTAGWHIATLHRIVMPDGSIPHEHPKDYTLRDCSRVRIEEPRG